MDVTQDTRQAYAAAFEKAVSALQAEVEDITTEDQVPVVLTGVENELQAWEDECSDEPVPPIPTLDSLRSKLRYILVSKQEWKEVHSYTQEVHEIFDSHMGGGTSMSYKLFALFRKGLARVRSSLRNSHDRALCELIALTKAMADNDDWYADTDVPEEAEKIVAVLGSLWNSVLSSPSDQDLRMLKTWLESVQEEWEVTASDHLGRKLTFAFSTKPPVTPKRTPAKNKAGNIQEESGSKKRKATTTLSPDGKEQKISVEMEAWLHRMDAELPRRQCSLVQLRCAAGAKKRVLVVSGSYPLKAVGCTVVEAFGWAADDFDPHPNKGKAPAGLAFSMQRVGGPRELIKPTVKIVQAVQEPGDQISVHMDGHEVVRVTLDAIMMKDDSGFSNVRKRPLPRCVGGDASLGPQLLKRLNRTFLNDRMPIRFIGCGKKEAVRATIDHMAQPIATEQGRVVVEGYGSGISAQSGTISGDLLKPLVI